MEPSRNFDLRLSGTLTAVSVEVIDSPAGQYAAPVVLPCPVSPDTLKDLRDLMPGVDLEATGRALWRCAFGDRVVERMWGDSKPEPGSDGILRLRLTIDSAELAALPWELLYDETLGRFLALDSQTPVTRFTRLPIPSNAWPLDRPLRLLFTGASPAEMPTLAVFREWAEIEQVLAPLVRDGRLETPQPIPEGATRHELLAALRRKADIWHFAGHGTDSALIFCDDHGKVDSVNAAILGPMLAGEGVRLAVINACRAGTGGGQAASVAGALLRAGVPAVVAMQGNLSDVAANVFAGAFYDAIAVGQGVDQALAAARKEIWAVGASEWWTPALFMRTPEGRIWRGTVTRAAAGARAVELAYLDGVIEKYQYWVEKYTPLAGIAEVRTDVPDGPRLDLPSLFMPTGFEKLEEHGFGVERRTERVPVDDLREAVSKYRRLVILGEPGAGKTTTLWRLAYDLAVAAKNDPHAPLPLFVPLGGYAGPESALAYAQEYMEELRSQLPAYLRNGHVILLLDALNEMPRKDYQERVTRIQSLLNQFPDAPVIVSCRPQDYSSVLRLDKVEIIPLDLDRQRSYLHRYLGKTEGEKLFWIILGSYAHRIWRAVENAGGTWEYFKSTYFSATGVRTEQQDERSVLFRPKLDYGLSPFLKLTQNPFMLVMLVQIYATNRGALPQNRGRLFEAFVDILLNREQKRVDPSNWPGTDALRLGLASLAFSMQTGDYGTTVDTEWAIRHLSRHRSNAYQIINILANASLLSVSNGIVSFAHHYLQGYFAALALAGKLQRGGSLRSYFPKDWSKPNGWEEIMILLAGMLPDMMPLLRQLQTYNPALVPRCIVESDGKLMDLQLLVENHTRLLHTMFDHHAPLGQRDVAAIVSNYYIFAHPGIGQRSDDLPDINWVYVPETDTITGRQEFIYGDSEWRIEPDFWISRFPVTYFQYLAFALADDGFFSSVWWEGLDPLPSHLELYGEQKFPYPNHPADHVSWYDAIAFCRWLTAKAMDTPDLLPANLDRSRSWKITLPTEWQWEKAARGHDGRRYPWGKKYRIRFSNVAETLTIGGPHFLGKTSAVGMYRYGASPYGVGDLSGNVWEWCLNEYTNASNIQVIGDADRVVRGGSWSEPPHRATTTYRRPEPPYWRFNDTGFRLVVVGTFSATP